MYMQSMLKLYLKAKQLISFSKKIINRAFCEYLHYEKDLTF